MASPQKSRLGRGLGGLISAAKPPVTQAASPAGHAPLSPGYLEIQVGLVASPFAVIHTPACPM